ncbi:MAG: hypothetical protein HC804_00785 [Anaerolineae bacterium]|nr:hypothetical protein [Anaerolineae bacterium]
MEDVIGLGVDWPHRRVYWDRRLPMEQAYGVRRYPLGEEGLLDIVGDRQQLTLTTNVPFTLVIRDAAYSEAAQHLQTAVSAGTITIDLT